MKNNYSKLIRMIYIGGDLSILNITFLLAYFFRFDNLILPIPYWFLLLYFNLLWGLVSFLTDNYIITRLDSYGNISKKMLKSVILHFFSVTVIFVFIKTTYFSRYHLLYTYLLFSGILLFFRIAIIYIARIYREKGFNLKRVVVVGHNELGQNLLNFFKQKPELGYKVLGIFDNSKIAKDIVGKLQDLEKYIYHNAVDEIYCTDKDLNKEDLKKLLTLADRNLIRLKIVPNLNIFSHENLEVQKYGEIPVVSLRREPLNNALNQFLKRSFDIVFSSLVMILILSWVIPIIALLIRLNSKGPIFFIQKRSGRDGRKFSCFKFRTMYHRKDNTFVQAKKNDSRITPIGGFLRKTNLDELPQFFNVFLGDMTVVGPRPHPIELDNTFKTLIDKYMVRHFVKPGITGLAQAKGYRGETKDQMSMSHRVKMDIFYIENWSFYLDIKIILMTLRKMMKGDSNAF